MTILSKGKTVGIFIRMLGDKKIGWNRMMNRVIAAAAFFCLMCIPVFAIEKNVWTCSSSGEIYFEIAVETDELFSTPADETAKTEEAVNIPAEELNEVENENPGELVQDEVATAMDDLEFVSGEEQIEYELTVPEDELDFVDYEENEEHPR